MTASRTTRDEFMNFAPIKKARFRPESPQDIARKVYALRFLSNCRPDQRQTRKPLPCCRGSASYCKRAIPVTEPRLQRSAIVGINRRVVGEEGAPQERNSEPT